MNGATGHYGQIDTLQRVELADGVEVELRMAGPFLRGVAWVVDLSIKIGLLIVLGLICFLGLALIDEGLASGVFLLGMFLIVFLYHALLESGKRQGTWGKRLCGLKVTTLVGGRISFGQSLMRNLSRLADMLPVLTIGEFPVPCFALGLISILFTKRFQRLGDLVAGTLVVYGRPYQRRIPNKFVGEEMLRPRLPLRREEQAALIEFYERAPSWPDERKIEMTDRIAKLSGAQGELGAGRVVSMARWLMRGDRDARS